MYYAEPLVENMYYAKPLVEKHVLSWTTGNLFYAEPIV